MRVYQVLCAFALLALCLFTPINAQFCDDCMNHMAMPGCPFPEFCGFDSIDCTGCKDSFTRLSECPGVCKNVTCGSQCMDGMPMPGCQDPAACGFKPTPCVGCVVGQATLGCPKPEKCRPCTTNATDCSVHDTPKCYGCVEGKSSSLCPDPTICAHLNTAPCIGCINGTVTDTCPDPSFCGFEPACTGCVAGKQRPSCPNYAACGGHDTAPCIDCMDGMAMPQCPLPDQCGFAAAPGGNPSCVMMMVFGASSGVCVFLSEWYVSTAGEWIGLTICIFAAALFREFIMIHRQHRVRTRRIERMEAKASTTYSGSNTQPLMDQEPPHPSMMQLVARDFPQHFIDSTYYLINLIVAYLLMLLIMSYNIGLCMIVVMASFFAHLIVTTGFAAKWKHDAINRRNQSTNRIMTAAAPIDEFKQSEDPCCADGVYDFED